MGPNQSGGRHQEREQMKSREIEEARESILSEVPSWTEIESFSYREEQIRDRYARWHAEDCNRLNVPETTTPGELDAIESRAAEIRIEQAAQRLANRPSSPSLSERLKGWPIR